MKINSLIESLWIDNSSVKNAVSTYIRRKNRDEHPEGEFDNGGRWYPDEIENLDTRHYRTPSRSFPYSYMTACRTLRHAVEDLEFLFAPSALRASKRLARVEEQELDMDFTKQVTIFKKIISEYEFEIETVYGLIELKEKLENLLNNESKFHNIRFLEKEIQILEDDIKECGGLDEEATA